MSCVIFFKIELMKSLKESLLNKPKNLTGSIERMNEDIIVEFLKRNYNGHDFDEKYMTIKYVNNETIVDYKGSLIFDDWCIYDYSSKNSCFRKTY